MSDTKHKCFISFKTENTSYKNHIQYSLNVDMIDKSLNEPINSDDEDYIMRKIREDYLSDSTVTIFLIGKHSAENDPNENQTYIKRELQASLYNGTNNTRNGILGVVLPEMINSIYKGKYSCPTCGESHNAVVINNDTVIREFNYNYYIPKLNNTCHWTEDERYCVLVRWDDFCESPETYIDKAFQKRNSSIANKVKVYPD
jgi:hypothetical protein